uniref:Arginine-hydroxylase NDUFAF5, mitochondrial n=1 Tax=Ceriodaphnia reticulata TaxID=302197 RepID=A0A4Y7LTY7_9CRUS|nr:EOG090X09JT [Ceriodaphnia reticulata]SVE73058.1 EOG090X09JT [Ceriodaphnia reticulata]
MIPPTMPPTSKSVDKSALSEASNDATFQKSSFYYGARKMSQNAMKGNVMNVFDRQAKKLQRGRTAMNKDYRVFNYLKDEVGYRLSDRVYDINRKFKAGLDLGCGYGHLSKHLTQDAVEDLVMCDHSSLVLEKACPPEDATVNCRKMVVDEEALPFEPESFDLVMSSLSLHWVNQLPSTFSQIMRSLRPDGVFIGALFGGETLYELRGSLQLGETEREGGFAAHISPFAAIRDIGGLLNAAGFTMLTIDTDELRIGYPSMFELMEDLKGMGENNASWIRKLHLHRDTMFAASAIYKELYGNEDGTIPATFQIIYLIGWKPDPSQPKPLERGTGEISIKDLYRLDEVVKNATDEMVKKTAKEIPHSREDDGEKR